MIHIVFTCCSDEAVKLLCEIPYHVRTYHVQVAGIICTYVQYIHKRPLEIVNRHCTS